MRKYWKDAGLEQFSGIRTKFLRNDFEAAFTKLGVDATKAKTLTQAIMETLGKIDTKKVHKLATLVFISPKEIQHVAAAVASCTTDKEIVAAIKKAMKGTLPRDAVDIALFGRMFADEQEFSVDACCMVAHALSTHKASSELDFWTAMDENKPSTYENEAHDEGAGAGMMDSAEFVSATFYHYCALNLDMLKEKLPHHSPEEIQAIVHAFVEAFAIAIPSARQNGMNAHTRPSYVRATIQTGQPMQLVGAFEEPVRAAGHGYAEPSVDRLIGHSKSQESTWGISYELEVSTPARPFQALLDEVCAHV